MLQQSEGIVFRVFPFRDNSLILKLFTREFGMRSFVVRGSKRQKGNNLSKLQPLNLLRLSWTEREGVDLNFAKSIDIAQPYKSIPGNVEKACIVLFLSEILYKTVREEFENNELYAFLRNALLYLDYAESYSNFHIVFLLKLTQFYGYLPLLNSDEGNSYFDMQEGHLGLDKPRHDYYFSQENSNLLKRFSGMNFDASESIKLTRDQRNLFLNDIINFYRYHINEMGEIKGHEVLQTVFS